MTETQGYLKVNKINWSFPSTAKCSIRKVGLTFGETTLINSFKNLNFPTSV